MKDQQKALSSFNSQVTFLIFNQEHNFDWSNYYGDPLSDLLDRRLLKILPS